MVNPRSETSSSPIRHGWTGDGGLGGGSATGEAKKALAAASPQASFLVEMSERRKSTGTGNTMVELFSVEISVSVCR